MEQILKVIEDFVKVKISEGKMNVYEAEGLMQILHVAKKQSEDENKKID